MTLTSGVHQGSVLGPILLTLYQAPLGSICKKHGVTYHLYADDQQIYSSFKPMKKGVRGMHLKTRELHQRNK